MSTAAIHCPKCGVQNLNSAQFCGGCGTQVGALPQAPQSATQPVSSTSGVSAKGDKDWHEMAGLICGIASMFMCGIIASIPGLYFSWSARGIAKAQGRGTGMATTGMVLSIIGILVTIASIVIMILVFVMAASTGQPDPMMDFNNMQPGPMGY